MPAPLADTPAREAIDWAGIRAAAVLVGIRQAARQACQHFPTAESNRFVERVLKRASREGWLECAEKSKAIAAETRPSAMSANVRTGAEIVSAMGESTRAKLANVIDKAATRLEQTDPDELLTPVMADVTSKYTGAADKLHGYTAKQQDRSNGTVINIALAGLTPEMVSVSDMPLDCARMPVESPEALSGALPLPDPIG